MVDSTICKGCDCYDDRIEIANTCDAGVEPFIDTFECPCLNCLIKMCCTNVCDRFDKYSKKFDMKVWSGE